MSVRTNPEVINPVSVEDAPAWVRAMLTTFLSAPDGDAATRRIDIARRSWNADRTWGVRDRGRWVATLLSERRSMTVPGHQGRANDLQVDALTAVTVAATHRRRGLMSRMLTPSLRAARERGDAVSVLIAAEWPIYGRFGYAPAALGAEYVLRPRQAGAVAHGDPGTLYPVEPDELGKIAPQVFAASCRLRAGQMDRSQTWWNRVLGLDGYAPMDDLPPNWLVHDGPEGPDGLIGWSPAGEFVLSQPAGVVKVADLAAASDAAYADLWAYLCGIDNVSEVRLPARPVDEPVSWLLADARGLKLTECVDFLWLRILDVPAALSARSYALPGRLVLEVRDDAGEQLAAGRYLLETQDQHAECRPTTEAPDLEITQRTLASIYLGGYRLRQQLIAGGAHELTPGSLERADLMFSTPLAPWNATWF